MNTNNGSYVGKNFQKLIDAFTEIDFETMFEGVSDQGCEHLTRPLRDAANEAKSNKLHYTILRLLHDVCEVSLKLDTPHNPFNDSFSDTEIDFFAEIIKFVSNPFLKGRLADRVWSSPKYRGREYARIAIDSYTSIPLTADAWFRGGEACWQRAIGLCMLIGEESAENRLDQIQCSILAAIEEATAERGFYGSLLIHALDDSGLAKDHSSAIASKLEFLAQAFDAEGNFIASGSHYNAAAGWYKRSGMDEKSWDMMVEEARAFEQEAMAFVSSSNPTHMAAVTPLKDAARVLLGIPNEYRERHGINEKIDDLESRIGEYGQVALGEMATYTTPGIDISDYASQARAFVSGKPAWEAFVNFTSLYDAKVEDIRSSALKTLSEYPLRRIFHTIGFESDGRVGGTIPGYSESASDEDNEAAICDEMFRFHYVPYMSVAVSGMILPALFVLNREKCMRLTDFLELARRSTIVPVDRRLLWSKALFQGFNFDFESSIHLLAPQIEHMVRWQLKGQGIRTTFTDYKAGGRETENGLSSLMEEEEVERIFGPDWTYEIKTLFCGPIGWNIRNEVAHGLLSDYQFSSDLYVYVWWFALKMMLRTSPPITTVTEASEESDN